MHYPSLPAGTLLAAILVLVPSPSHWRARNVATLALISWFFFMNLIYAVNSLVWADNVHIRLRVWCDITTKLMIGASSGIPAATLCICKHLELVASGRVVRLTADDHRRRKIFELSMCIGVPIILMVMHCVVQGHRFDIIEDFGCQPATYYSIPAVFIVWFPPLLMSLATLVFSVLSLAHFMRQRINFAAHLSSSGSSLSTNRYLRLMAMSLTEIVWGTSLTAMTMSVNIAAGIRPWTNWADVHSDFGRIAQFRLFLIPPTTLKPLFVGWWAMPVSAYIFFLFFAFGEESLKDYRRIYNWIKRVVFRRSANSSKASKFSSLPFSSLGSNSTPKHVIVHKLSTVDIHIDSDDDQTLPLYSPASDNSVFSTSLPDKGKSKCISGSDITMDFVTVQLHNPPDPLVPSPFSAITSSSASTSSFHSAHRISISDEYPASRPPTPPMPIPQPALTIEERRRSELYPPQLSPAYQRPFSPPTIYRVDQHRVASPLPPHSEDITACVQVTVHTRADDIV